MNLESTSISIDWKSPWEFHYRTDSKTGAFLPGELILYDPIKQEARAQTIIPSPGLLDRDSPHFDPCARKITHSESRSWDAFSVRPDGIYLSNPRAIRELVEHLQHTQGLERVFTPCPLPDTRWENAQLIPEDESPAWAEYRKLLSGIHANSFVRLKRYRIADGSLNDRLLHKWPEFLNGSHAPFLELMRHPRVESDFTISERDDAMLANASSWRYLSPFLVSGWLAQVLHDGGLYASMSGGEIPAALKAGENVFRELNRDYRNFGLWVTTCPWMRELWGIVGIHTWIFLDREERSLVIFMASDSD